MERKPKPPQAFSIYPTALLLAISGCSGAEQPVPIGFEVVGALEHSKIREASGLARSRRQSGLLWIINDNGAREIVHAIDGRGHRLGEFQLKKSRNRDWEDLASFRLDETPYLMIADIGDNEARRNKRTLYFVEEPSPEKKAVAKTSWNVDFRYPNGPRDAESAAVDVDKQRVLILSKRDVPPRLFEVPLYDETGETVTATLLGAINSLPRPTRQEIEFAPKLKVWHWQPVGMDISADNLAAVILTSAAVYYFERQPEQSWLDALNTKPVRISLGNFQNAEAISFGDKPREVFVTGENKNSRLLRIDLAGVHAQ